MCVRSQGDSLIAIGGVRAASVCVSSVAVSNCNDFWDELGCVTAQSRSFSRWCKHLCMWVVACLFVFYCVFCGGEAVSDCHGFWD